MCSATSLGSSISKDTTLSQPQSPTAQGSLLTPTSASTYSLSQFSKVPPTLFRVSPRPSPLSQHTHGLQHRTGIGPAASSDYIGVHCNPDSVEAARRSRVGEIRLLQGCSGALIRDQTGELS